MAQESKNIVIIDTHPKIRAIIALLPGFKAEIAVQANRYDTIGWYAYARYAWAPPFSGIAAPNSAKDDAPVHAKIPLISQTIILAPTDPVLATTTPGDELLQILS